MQFVDKDDIQSLGAGDLFHDGLETFLEFAAELRTGDERTKIERHKLLVAQPFGNVAADDALSESFGDRGFADARFADKHRIVLRAARQHLNHAANFFVAADHGIELALARGFREIARELLDCLILPFGRLVGDFMRAAHELERIKQRLPVRADGGQCARAVGAFGVGERQQQVFGGDVFVAERLGFLFGGINDLSEFATEGGLRVALLRVAGSLLFGGGANAGDIGSNTLQHRHHDAFALGKQRQQEMQIVDEGIAGLTRERDGFVERLSAFHGQTVGIDHGVLERQSQCRTSAANTADTGAEFREGSPYNRRVSSSRIHNGAPSPSTRRAIMSFRLGLVVLVDSGLLHHDHLFHQRHAIHFEAIQIHARSGLPPGCLDLAIPIGDIVATLDRHFFQRLTSGHPSGSALQNRRRYNLHDHVVDLQTDAVLPTRIGAVG